MRCLLIGNYGIGNFGDEALKEYFLAAFPEVDWLVVSAHPKEGEFYRLPAGIRSLFSPWYRTLKALKQADAVVFGGGTLFTDIESPRACFIWFVHAFCAYIYRKPFLLAFQGIGPFRKSGSEKIARWVVRRAASLSVRDAVSAGRVEAWNTGIKIVQSFDPIYSLIPVQKKDGSQNVFILIPRQNSSGVFLQQATAILARHPTTAIRILTFEPGNPDEQEICGRLIDAFPVAVLKPVITLQDLLDGLSDAAHVLTERYHGALAALAADIPFEVVSQGKGDKLSTVMDMRQMGRDRLMQYVKTGESALKTALESVKR
ncbi:MAG TPA: polysaccharide pyruvyl transferase family protein [Candidatus Peribacteraceae bacterium]|nr:polysaccharide pyruvyl transferase family protein [Candidatus Peribacteraceae bacterium]